MPKALYPTTRPNHGFGRYSIPSRLDHDMPLPPPMSARLRKLTFSESAGRNVNPAKPLTAVGSASIGVTDRFGVLNSTLVENVKVRSPPMTAKFFFSSLSRY